MIEDSSTWQTHRLPSKQPYEGWSVWRGEQKLCLGIDEVRFEFRNWNPFSRDLVGAPSSVSYALPTDVSELQGDIEKRIKKNLVLATSIWGCFGISNLILFLFSKDGFYLAFGGVMCLLALMTLIERYFGLNDLTGLSERAMFFHWLQSSRTVKRNFIIYAVIGVISGMLQFLLQQYFGDLELLILKYGFYYPAIRNGEFWRVISIPFFHSGLVHFLNNYFMLIFIAPIAWSLVGGGISLFVFFGACFFGGFAQMLFGSINFDALYGASGGVLGFYGLIVALHISGKSVLPKGFVFIIFGIAAISIFGSEVFSPNSGTTSHIAGFLFGFGVALFYRRDSRQYLIES